MHSYGPALGTESIKGIWENDKPRSGKAIFVREKVGTYQGEWKDGKRLGFGLMINPNGKCFEGLWENGKIMGRENCALFLRN